MRDTLDVKASVCQSIYNKKKKTALCLYKAKFRGIDKTVKLWAGKQNKVPSTGHLVLTNFYSYGYFISFHFIYIFLNSSFDAPFDLHWDLYIVDI